MGCHIEGDSVDTIGALRPMGGIWASNNKSRASITLIIKFRDSPERGGHFEESPTEILQRMRFYKDPDSTKNEILQRTRFYKERDSTKNEILQHRGPPPHGGPLGQQQQVQGPLHPHHQVHRSPFTLCLTRCTRCTSEATKKRE